MLPDLNDAIEHLRIEPGYDDSKVQLCLNGAIALVKGFLDWSPSWDDPSFSSSSEQPHEINDAIVCGILLIVEHLYDGRSAGDGEILRVGSTEWMLLQPFRSVGV
jgi:hypothetical protein